MLTGCLLERIHGIFALIDDFLCKATVNCHRVAMHCLASHGIVSFGIYASGMNETFICT